MAKQLLGTVDPWLLAGLSYRGSGVGLALWRLLTRAETVKLAADQRVWLAGAVVACGVLGPLLLMFGLSRMPASGASLLLTAERPFAGRHSHPHRHEPLTHAHAHFPDAHHRHGH